MTVAYVEKETDPLPSLGMEEPFQNSRIEESFIIAFQPEDPSEAGERDENSRTVPFGETHSRRTAWMEARRPLSAPHSAPPNPWMKIS